MDPDVITFILGILSETPLSVKGSNIVAVADLMLRAEAQLTALSNEKQGE